VGCDNRLQRLQSVVVAVSGYSGFVCAALGSTLAERRCNRTERVKTGSPVVFHCVVNCTSDNLTNWYYYKNLNETDRTEARYIGYKPNPRWSSIGISVNYNRTASHSVLKIEKVTTNITGAYECHAIHHDDDPDGCKMRFCLETGERQTFS